jgi:ribosomal protein S18
MTSDAIVSTALTACFLLLISIYNDLIFCVFKDIVHAHNESCKRVDYKNDRFFSRFLFENVKIWQRGESLRAKMRQQSINTNMTWK